MSKGQPALQRFAQLCQPQDSGCILWVGKLKRGHGYGVFNAAPQEKAARAHVWIFKQAFGYQPMILHHSCGNRACVALAHLQPTDAASHMREHHSLLTCKRGHRMEGDNIYIHPKRGWRQCLTCRHTVWCVRKSCKITGCTAKSRKDDLCYKHRVRGVMGLDD